MKQLQMRFGMDIKINKKKIITGKQTDILSPASSLILNAINENINSYFDDERVSFEDSVLVTFKVPVPVQMFLSKHKNYKIRIISKDLTTQERG